MRIIFPYILLFLNTFAFFAFRQSPLTGLYKGIGGESYLSIKEKKGKFEGDIYEKGKDILHLKGNIKDGKILGNIWLNALVERPFTGQFRIDTLDLFIKVPNDTAYAYIHLSFKKISNKQKIDADRLFGVDTEHPSELIGTWTHIDLQTKRQVGYNLKKNGEIEFVGYSMPNNASVVNTTWYVRNGYLYNRPEIPGWDKNPPAQENSYKLVGDTLTIDWANTGKTEVFFRKIDKKK